MVPHIWHSMGKHLSRAVRARKESRLLFLETDENDGEGFWSVLSEDYMVESAPQCLGWEF